MELVNVMYKFAEKGRKEEELRLFKGAVETVLALLFPFVPHITEELWEMLGKDVGTIATNWPRYKEEYTIEDKVTVAIQVNGKLRDTCEVERDLDVETLKGIVLSLDKIHKQIEDKEIKKTIVVPNKLVNLVIG